MIHKSNLLNWVKTKIESLSREDESEHVFLESKLIRCVSEYRKLDIESIQLSRDFDLRLMNRLENVNLEDVELYEMTKKTYTLPVTIVSAFGFALVCFAFVNLGYFDSSEKIISASPTTKNIQDIDLLNELKSNPQKREFLEHLENYYAHKGKISEASELHNMLETVSKKY